MSRARLFRSIKALEVEAVEDHAPLRGRGIAVPEGTPVPRGLAAGRLPGGPYAVIRYRGSCVHIGRAFDALFRGWVVGSGVTLRPAPCLEIYLDGAGRVSERERRTDLCLPVSERP